MKIVEIIIRADGQISLETKGFEGSSCQAATRLIERALGCCFSERLTADFYSATNADEVRHQQGA